MKTQGHFEAGLEHFFNRDFPKATVDFDQVLQENPDDQVAKHFSTRAAKLIVEGVDGDWTGVEEIESK